MNDGRAYFKNNRDRLHQGDIFADVTLVVNATTNESVITVEERRLPYAVVLTQDCDLLQDFSCREIQSDGGDHDKYLPSIMLSPAYPAESLKLGKHLGDYSQKMQQFNSERFKQLKQNNNSRYHFIHSDNSFNVPELVVDFKHYFTIPRDIAYSVIFSGYMVTIARLFRENLSLRFCNYLSRIGLPDTVRE
jgi:hypothetical protein